ncbi:MAG: hypothetical protein KAU14_00035, partial [Thermoplasmata archaeon]|nr:hypothetical protein [Thermoplasmata archaeon]
NVNVEFWANDDYIDTGYINEIQPGENGSCSVDWKAIYGSHTMKIIADPDGSDGGPDEYEITLNVTQSTYSVVLYLPHNASWIKNSQTNYYYIKVTNRGSSSDTIDLSLEIKRYGSDPSGWKDIKLDEDSVNLDDGESTYVKLSVKYQTANIDYTAEAVVKVTAQSQGDSTRSDIIYATTNVIRDIPILYVDDDGQHANKARGGYLVSFDPPPDGGQYGPETDEINLGALEVNYKGLYHHIELPGDYQPGGHPGGSTDQGDSGPPYDASHGISPYTVDSKRVYLKDYDVVIWDTGYSETLTASGNSWDRWDATHAWYDQSEIMTYLKNGGAILWQNNKGTEWHDHQAGWYTNPLYTNYFKADRCIQEGGLGYEIVGVADDPVGTGVEVENSFIYSLPGDRSDSIFPKSEAHGVYYAGSGGYNTIRYEHPRESSSNQRYKNILQTKQWASFGDYNDYDHPMRVRSVTQSMSWLGVPPKNAPEYDLGIKSIESPFGEYVNPGDSIPLEVMVKNTGHKDITTQFSVKFKVKDMDSGSPVFQKTVDVNDDLNATDDILVSTSWDTNRPIDGHHYNVTFEISYGDDGDSDNNEMYTHQEAKEVKDITILEASYERSTFYWNSTRIGDPTEVWCVVKNIGSMDAATFTVDLKIDSPVHTNVFSKTTTVEDIAPGREKRVSWIWTPRNPAGVLTDWHYTRREHEDAYDAQFKVNYAGDDNTSNNEKGIGTDSAPGIVVMGYCDGSEPRLMTEDWAEVDLSGHDNHGDPENQSTPIHLITYTSSSPTHAWAVGYYEGGNLLPTVEPDWNTVAISPKIDLKNYTRARGNWALGGHSGAGTFYLQISRDYDGNPEHVESASWSNLDQWSGYSTYYAWYLYTTGFDISSSFVGHDVHLRIRFVSDSDGGYCGPFVDSIAICGVVKQYNANDVGVNKVSIHPLIAEAEISRNIDVTVENYGENRTNDGGRPGFYVEVSIHDETRGEVYNKSQYVSEVLGIGDTWTVSFNDGNNKDWMPEDNGLYHIFARTIWEDNEENIDENWHNDLMVIDGVVQKSFFSDDMEHGNPPPRPEGGYYNAWETSGAANGWELGKPSKGPSAHSGDKCWATNLDGNYPDLMDDSIWLQQKVDLKTASDPVLTFWHWLEVEAHDYDTAYIEARTTEQDKWTVLWHNPTPERMGIPYRTNAWNNLTLSLEDFAYHEVYIRFRVQTDGDTNYLGWYIDDVGVGGTVPPAHDARIVSIDYPAEGSYIPP